MVCFFVAQIGGFDLRAQFSAIPGQEQGRMRGARHAVNLTYLLLECLVLILILIDLPIF